MPAFPGRFLGGLEEQLARGTVSLSVALEWTAPRETVFEVVQLAMPSEQFGTVTSVPAPPASFMELHEGGRLPFRPDLLQLIVEYGRIGSLHDFGFLGHVPETVQVPPPETAARCYPASKPRVKEPPITAKRGRGQRSRPARLNPARRNQTTFAACSPP